MRHVLSHINYLPSPYLKLLINNRNQLGNWKQRCGCGVFLRTRCQGSGQETSQANQSPHCFSFLPPSDTGSIFLPLQAAVAFEGLEEGGQCCRAWIYEFFSLRMCHRHTVPVGFYIYILGRENLTPHWDGCPHGGHHMWGGSYSGNQLKGEKAVLRGKEGCYEQRYHVSCLREAWIGPYLPVFLEFIPALRDHTLVGFRIKTLSATCQVSILVLYYFFSPSHHLLKQDEMIL